MGRGALVKFVLTSHVIYYITALNPPPSNLLGITKIEQAFLWAGTKKTTGAKCKVNWNSVCRSTDLGGLGILYLAKFARALLLRWLYGFNGKSLPRCGLGWATPPL